jgi:hypothetical protein
MENRKHLQVDLEVIQKGKSIELPVPAVELPRLKSLFWRIRMHPLCMPYNRLAVLMVLLNCVLGLKWVASPFDVLNAVVINFALATLIRQQEVVNLLFAIATAAPKKWPLSVRWALGKVYHFGGIHVGCYFSGFLWYAVFFSQSLHSQTPAPTLKGLVLVHLLLLVGIMVVALPPLRAKNHNRFEIVARFGNWASLLLFWILTLQVMPGAVLFSWQVWLLSLTTFSVVLPWLRLRKVPAEIATPSSHVALTKFNYGVKPFAGSSTELSRNPLLEWHSFANVPIPWQDGFQLTISRAGDWTGSWIDDKPQMVWVKGIPTAGVGNIETLFKKVVWVATGSGIGPCLPHLFANQVPSTLVWSTRNPRKTYGSELVEDILHVQPKALIWDTDQSGKPDLVQLAYQAYRDSGAEAVICISNKKVTWQVVSELESRGIPAFGAIWDS